MSKKALIFISVIFLAVLGAILIYLWTFRKADLSVNSKRADYEISAGELVQRFEDDEESANATFVDKVIIVTGTVDHVSEDDLTVTVYLKDENAISGILCSFDKSLINTDRIEQGNKVRIKGICSGYLLDVVMNRCSLAE